MSVYKTICESINSNRKQLAILVDPDKTNSIQAKSVAYECKILRVDYIFVGSSLLVNGDFESCIKSLRDNCNIPVIIFPGNNLQISSNADAIFFLSLISGRNPDMLIGNHIIAAPIIRGAGLEVIPTGYILINSGQITSVHYMSNTLPIPSDKSDIAICTAMAGEMLGLKLIYLEGGSGTDKPISKEMIEIVKKNISIPLIVGGGINSAKQAAQIWKAGADMIVVGNASEKNPEIIKQIVDVRNDLNSNN